MKSEPRSRRTVSIPKATGLDPAAPGAGQNPSKPHNAGVTTNTGERIRKSTVAVPESQLARWRAAWWLANAQNPGKYPSFKAWVSELLDAGAEDVERCYNGGEPLTPIPTGLIPTGRPLIFPS